MTTETPEGVEVQVESLPFDLSVLQDEGVFVNVDAKGFSCLHGRLRWQQLGVDVSKDGIELFAPTCSLLPARHAKALAITQGRSHQLLGKYAYRLRMTEALMGTSSYRWLTWKAFQEFEPAFTLLRTGLDKAKSEALDQYDAIVEEMGGRAQALAEASAKRLEATGHKVPEEFISLTKSVVMGMIPTTEDIEAISVKYTVGALQLSSDLLEEQRKALEEKNALVKARIDSGLLDEEVKAELETKAKIREMQLTAARDRLQTDLNPIEEAAKQLHAAMYESATAVMDALKQHGTVPAATARRARDMAKRFRLMSWSTDEDLEKLLAELETAATKPKDKKNKPLDPDAISKVAEEISKMCFADARDLGQVNRMGALEI